ncbi:hypothetical protein KQM40_004276 [Escherichia coli]|nr:hypothetical protein [Escherichia coli]
MRYYTGVGSRETPPEVISVMEDAAFRLAGLGFTLRSGKAEGADAAFQRGMQRYFDSLDDKTKILYGNRLAEIYIPWKGFGDKEVDLYDNWDYGLQYINHLYIDQIEYRDELVQKVHPNPQALLRNRAAFALHSRNVHQVLGVNINNPKPSSFVLYFAKEDKNGNPRGGTATAVNLAKMKGIKTLNLNTPERIKILETFLDKMEDSFAKVPRQTQ